MQKSGTGVNVSVGGNQGPHGFGVVFPGCPHERVLTHGVFLGVHFRPVREEHFDRRGIACSRSSHKDGFALGKSRIRIRTGFQEELQHASATARGGESQGSDAVAVSDFDICSRRQQNPCQVDVVPASGPMQRRHAVGLRGIHIDMLPDELAHTVAITVPRSVGDTGRTRPGCTSQTGAQANCEYGNPEHSAF